MEENGGHKNTATAPAENPSKNTDTPPPVTQTETGQVAPSDATRRDLYTSTTREVLSVFYREGLPRTSRSIERYCSLGKLECFLDPDQKQWYVRPDSVTRLIGYIKEVNARQSTPPPFATLADVGVRTADVPPTSVPPPVGEKGEESEEIQNLRNEVITLKIADGAKEKIIAHLASQITGDRKQFISELVQHTRKVGELEERLLQIEGRKAPEEGQAV